MAYQAARARSYLQEGRTLLPYLDRRSAACVAAFANLYEATLERIERAGFDVFGGPPRLSPLTKLRIVGAGLVLR
jgi:phytoene synthase